MPAYTKLLEEALAKLPKGSAEAQDKIANQITQDAMRAELLKKSLEYNPANPVGTAALSDIKSKLSKKPTTSEMQAQLVAKKDSLKPESKSQARTRAGTPASPTPLDEQLERTKTRLKGFVEDPEAELKRMVYQYLPSPNDSLEEKARKLDELAMGFAGTTIGKVPAKKASEVFGKHEGKTLMITEADRTKVGGGFLGGPGFSGLQHEYPAYKDAQAVWGVNSPSKASTMIGANARVPEGQAIWSPMLGSPTQHKSNQMVFDQILNKFRRAAKAGELDPELHAKINDALANAADKEGNPIFPHDVDIMGKNFRSLASTFDRRAAAADIMGGIGVGGKKGMIIDYPEIIRSTTDPVVIDSPVGSIGNRAFTLSGESGLHPELHPAFPYILKGEDLGEVFTPIPRELALKNFVEERMAATGKNPTTWAFTRGYGPTQTISEDWLTHLQKEGYAHGGSVSKPDTDQMKYELLRGK
jgi:hypothetical protein